MRIRYLKKTENILDTSPYVVRETDGWKGEWRKRMLLAAENDRIATPDELPYKRLSIEIGCGKGKYITRMALDHPNELFIGDERVSTILARTALTLEEESRRTRKYGIYIAPLSNVRLIRVSAEDLMDVFAEGELDRIFLTFSDPWPKEKHAKRRLTSDRFLPIYRYLLGPEGDLCFKTDNDDLFAYSVGSLQENGWKILELTDDLHGVLAQDETAREAAEKNKARLALINPGVLVTTEYEENFMRIKKNIHYLRAVPIQLQS